MKNEMIAHLRETDHVPQTVWEHLTGVSEITGVFAEKIGLKEAGELIGLMHDIGKASDEFQKYIKSATGMIDPDRDDFVDIEHMRGKIDHSSAGAQLLYSYLNKEGQSVLAAQFLSLCIASHHSGLIDCISPDGCDVFSRRMEKEEDLTHKEKAFSKLNKVEQEKIRKRINDERIVISIVDRLKSLRESSDTKDTLAFKFGLLIRFMFSCLIDADRLDTADFEHPQNRKIRNYGEYEHWEKLVDRLEKKVKEFSEKKDKNDVDELRNLVSQSCFESASKSRGIFQLSVPTGGGKTLSSLRFALHHAETWKMDRIFYIIPYTSIIDQNADEIRKVLEDRDESGQYLNNIVLEHHSNLTPDEESYRQKLLSQNWDAPVVLTTQVQFLEALFGSGTGNARRMHQLANSVIVFDEIQTIPLHCVHMFNVAVRFLVNNCGCTVVMCTATQPLLDKVDPPERSLGIPVENKIIRDEKLIFTQLRRTRILDRRKAVGWSIDEVADLALSEIDSSGSVLIIVNTRKSARMLYQVLEKLYYGKLFHLSTNMCPAHRLDVLSKIKKRLTDKQPVICISTQLIEAGVDIDFGSVIRYFAGLDSIAQAAGRCNRNGRREIGNVWVVNPADENLDRLIDIRIGKEKAMKVLDEFNINPAKFNHDRIGPELLTEYYRNYYFERQNIMMYPVGPQTSVGRKDDLFNLLSLNTISIEGFVQNNQETYPKIPFRQSFQSASRAFRVIDSPTRGVITPYTSYGKKIITELCGEPFGNNQFYWMKQAQRYSVNMFCNYFESLGKSGAIKEVRPESGIFYLSEQYYSQNFGWCEEPEKSMDNLIY